MIKVIKRDKGPESLTDKGKKRRQKRRPTMTATVNDWIAESRQNRIDTDSSSRRTIEGWESETES